MDIKNAAMLPPVEQHQDASESNSVRSSFSDSSNKTDTRRSGESQAEEVIADSLSRVVGRWRACVVIMLLITAALVVTTTYLFLSSNEEAQFRKAVSTVPVHVGWITTRSFSNHSLAHHRVFFSCFSLKRVLTPLKILLSSTPPTPYIPSRLWPIASPAKP